MSSPEAELVELGAAQAKPRDHTEDARPQQFPIDAWYMAAWANEVREGLFSRRLLERPVLMYRRDNGEPVAMDDRCAHRFAPLSRGRKTPAGVECGYHGLQFDHGGRCIHNPVGDGLIPSNTCVRTYPLIERHRMLWIWMGDPSLADERSIPNFSQVPTAGSGHDNIDNYLLVKANYLLEIDNLMDLSHVNFLHLGSLGHESMRSAQVRVNATESRIRADLWMPDTICGYGPMRGQSCDQWNNMIWMPPTSMLLEFGAVQPGALPRQEPDQLAFHIVTPETTRTTHYFFGTSGCFSEADAWKAAVIREAQTQAFLTEDNPMIEAVDAQMGDEDFWDLRPTILSSDKAAIRVRLRIKQMCRQEQARRLQKA